MITKQELEEIRSEVNEKNELEGIMRRYGFTPRTPTLDGMPRGTRTSDITGNLGTKRADLKLLWDERVDDLAGRIKIAEEQLAKLPSIYRRIVRLYYFEGMGDKRIARNLHMNFDVIGRKRREALLMLERRK